jgi:divalent metal cation (Fe/Co/Zn/Cd) transporter
MVASETTKRVLEALADALPEEGTSPVKSLRIHDGWGNMVFVAIHTALSRSSDHELGNRIKDSVEGALGGQRHRVEIIWESLE